MQVSATLLAASSSSGADPASALANGRAGAHQPPALLETLRELLDPDSHATVSPELTEAALDAVARLGSTVGGAELFFTGQHALAEIVATLALGRTSMPGMLATHLLMNAV